MLPARRFRSVVLACTLASLLVVKAAPEAQRAPVTLIPGPAANGGAGIMPSPQDALAYFRGRIAADGDIGVIVEARTPALPVATAEEPAPDATESARSLAEWRIFAEARQRIMRRLPPQEHPVREYDFIPFVALIANATTFEVLLSDPNVVSIQEDFAVPPALAESIPLIQADAAWAKGYTGANVSVAILDTGVQKSHPDFGGNVLSEACYSGGGKKADSLCPNKALSSTAKNSAAPCTTSDSCSHGTHVAATAAGLTGVARNSWVIAIQVFSKDGSKVTARASDLIKALERVYALDGSWSIGAVNMSVGEGAYTKTCDSASPAMVQIVGRLYARRIAVVAPSGNDGYSNRLSWPACHSKVVSVGNSTKSDEINTTSNAASFLRLLAPGTDIFAAVPGNGYGHATGTSMAAAHVTGTWALLTGKTPSLKVDAGLAALRSTGLDIRDSRSNITFKRIRVDDGLNKLKGATLATAISPSGTSPSTKPTYSWKKVAASTHYRLAVEVSRSGEEKVDIWYKSSAVCKGNVCSVTPNVVLTPGETYYWWVATLDYRHGPWSVGTSFVTPGGAVRRAAPMSTPRIPGSARPGKPPASARSNLITENGRTQLVRVAGITASGSWASSGASARAPRPGSCADRGVAKRLTPCLHPTTTGGSFAWSPIPTTATAGRARSSSTSSAATRSGRHTRAGTSPLARCSREFFPAAVSPCVTSTSISGGSSAAGSVSLRWKFSRTGATA